MIDYKNHNSGFNSTINLSLVKSHGFLMQLVFGHKLDVNPSPQGNYPYTTVWKDRYQRVWAKEIPLSKEAKLSYVSTEFLKDTFGKIEQYPLALPSLRYQESVYKTLTAGKETPVHLKGFRAGEAKTTYSILLREPRHWETFTGERLSLPKGWLNVDVSLLSVDKVQVSCKYFTKELTLNLGLSLLADMVGAESVELQKDYPNLLG